MVKKKKDDYEILKYKGVDKYMIKAMYEGCVRQGIDFNNLDTIPFTAGFKAGVEYMKQCGLQS